MAREIVTSVVVGAAPERVWAVLTDFAAYPAWNSFLLSVTGKAAVGARLKVRARVPGLGIFVFRPTLLTVAPREALIWRGGVVLAGWFDGEHRFLIEPQPGGAVRFVQAERFEGWLVPLLWPLLRRRLARGFRLMNALLKQRAEEPPA